MRWAVCRTKLGMWEQELDMSMNVSQIVANFKRENNTLLNRSHRVQVQRVAAKRKWTPIFIWAMTKWEMEQEGVAGQTACFHVLLSTIGEPVWVGKIEDDMGLSLRYGWGDGDFRAPFEKTFPEPHGNFVMGAGAEYWAKIDDIDGTPSDTVTGITLTNREDEADPFAHHTTLVIWQLQDEEDVPVVVERPEGGYATISLAKLREAQRAAKELYEALLGLG